MVYQSVQSSGYISHAKYSISTFTELFVTGTKSVRLSEENDMLDSLSFSRKLLSFTNNETAIRPNFYELGLAMSLGSPRSTHLIVLGISSDGLETFGQ